MLFLLKLVLWAFRALALSRRVLVLENLALRQQLAIVAHGGRRPRLGSVDRLFWVALRQLWPDWSKALAIVQPATVVAWHRRAFHAYWRRISRKQGRPPIDVKLRELIGRMVRENRWGAPRIHGELLTLGFQVSERTVSRYVRAARPHRPSGTAWKTFLDNHREALAAMDFFLVPTLTFRLRYVLLVIRHDRRRVLHWNVTAHPTAGWVIQQLREAFPFETRPRYILLDRDSIFSTEVCQALRRMHVQPIRTAYRSPWQNGVAERWIGTCRRELLDHVIVLNEQHLWRLLREFVAYYHDDRTHLSLGKDPPARRAVCPRPSPTAQVASLPRIGGLHHRYEWAEAA
jgi:putative transposase